VAVGVATFARCSRTRSWRVWRNCRHS